MIVAGGLEQIVEGSALTVAVEMDDPRPADVATVEAWVNSARHGDEILYAMDRYPKQALGPKRLRAFYDLGMVELFGRRLDNVWHCFARRTMAQREGAVWPIAVDAAEPVTPAVKEAARLLGELREVANDGLPCPSNAQLAAAIDVMDSDRVSYLLKILRKWNAIAVELIDAEPRRLVTIVATGRTTGILEQRRAG